MTKHSSDGRQEAAFSWELAEPVRAWETIVLHHSATERGDVETIHKSHLKKTDGRGRHWLGIGYHFVIGNGRGMPDGAIEPTFRWHEQLQGAHAGIRHYNETGIGIVLVGNFEQAPPTPAQKESVCQLVSNLCQEFDIAPERIVKHGDLKATACPGRFFALDEVIASVAALDDSSESPPARSVPATGISRKEALRK